MTQAHYTVTALYMDAEIAAGEGDSHEYAVRECMDGVSDMYPAEDVTLECKSSAMPHVVVTMPLDLAQRAFA
ncbi:hypothetical protein DFLDMN_001520 [Cupriavidus sp. H19C3]|uniref:hypothetical protein n=1 Tax=Cupriavidus sp. H19C3 TaxID=3241603 RepID=UPI003BF8887A